MSFSLEKRRKYSGGASRPSDDSNSDLNDILNGVGKRLQPSTSSFTTPAQEKAAKDKVEALKSAADESPVDASAAPASERYAKNLEVQVRKAAEAEEIAKELFATKEIKAFLNEANEDLDALKNKLFTGPQIIEGSDEIIEDADPYKLSLDWPINTYPDFLKKKRLLLMSLINSVDKKVIINKGNKSESLKDISNGVLAIPNHNVKIFNEIEFNTAEYLKETNITLKKTYLDVDQIFPMLRKGKNLDFNIFSREITDDDLKEDDIEENKVERCDVKFVKYLDEEKNFKVDVIFNPLSNQIGFFLFIRENVKKEDGSNKSEFLCHYRSFYIIQKGKSGNTEIIFRPYNNNKKDIPVPEYTRTYKQKSFKNYIKEINKYAMKHDLYNGKKITSESTFEEIFEPIFSNKLVLKDILDLIQIDESEKVKIKDEFKKKQIKLIKFFDIYKRKGIRKTMAPITDDEINTFEVKLKEIRLGSEVLNPAKVKTIKRFCKLDPLFKLKKHKEIQQKLIPQTDLEGKGFTKAFDLKTWIDEKIKQWEVKNNPLKLKSKEEYVRKKDEYEKEIRGKFENSYDSSSVLANKEYDIYEPVDFAYFTPFTLTDILNDRYKKKSMYEKLGLTDKYTPSNKAKIENLFTKIEELRSFVFTFASIYYEFERNPSESVLKRIKIPIYKIYPNQLYSPIKKIQPVKTVEIKYFLLLNKLNNLLSTGVNEADIIIDLKFLILAEGIITEEQRASKYEYIKADELFVPKLEIALTSTAPNRDELIKVAYEELTTYNVMYDEVSTLFAEDIVDAGNSNILTPEITKLSRKEWIKHLQSIGKEAICKNCFRNKFKKVKGRIICNNPKCGTIFKESNEDDRDEDDSDDDDDYIGGELEDDGGRGKKDIRDARYNSIEKYVHNIWLRHLAYLLGPKEEPKKSREKEKPDGEGFVEKKAKSKKISDILVYTKTLSVFDQELAQILRKNERRLKLDLISILKKSNDKNDKLNETESNIYIKYFNKENNSKLVKDGIILVYKDYQNPKQIHELLKKDNPAPEGQSESRYDGSDIKKLSGNPQIYTDIIFQRIISTLISIEEETPDAEQNPSFLLTLTKGRNYKFEWPKGSGKMRSYYKEIPEEMQRILQNYSKGDSFVEATDKEIAEKLLSDDLNNNKEALLRIFKKIDIQLVLKKTDKGELIRKIKYLQELSKRKTNTIGDKRRLLNDLKILKIVVPTEKTPEKIKPEEIKEIIEKKINELVEQGKDIDAAETEKRKDFVLDVNEIVTKLEESRQDTNKGITPKKISFLQSQWEKLANKDIANFESRKTEITSRNKFLNNKQKEIRFTPSQEFKALEEKILEGIEKNIKFEQDAKTEGIHEIQREKKLVDEAQRDAQAKEALKARIEAEEKAAAKAAAAANKQKKGKKGGGDYEKYMKYKFKYLKLKELFKNAL